MRLDDDTLPASATSRVALWLVVFTVFVDMIGFGIVMPVLPRLISSLTGLSVAGAARDAGWLAFGFAVTQFIFAPATGSLSDRFGRRPVIIAALAAFTANYLFTAFAPSIFWLYVGRIIAGATGASFTTAYAYVTDISPRSHRTQNFGLLGMAMGAGFVIGPGIGGLAAEWSPRAPFFVAAGLAALNVLLALFFLTESLPAERRRRFDPLRANPVGALSRMCRVPILLRFAVSILLVQISSVMLSTVWPFYVIQRFQWTPLMIGASLTFSGVLTMFIRGGLIRLIVPRYGEQRVVLGAMLAQCAGFALLAGGASIEMMYVGISLHSLSGVAYPALSGLASHQVSSSEQGGLQGGIACLTGLAAILAPIFSSQLFGYFSAATSLIYLPAAPLLLGILFSAITFVIMRRLPGLAPAETNAV
jgi:MFS transporter, DHA1 family, tetracycline resistance protein